MGRLIAVSNRLANLKPGEADSGGLAVGLKAALKERGGLWFGWSGRPSKEDSEAARLVTIGNTTFATIDIAQESFQGYYKEYSNRSLWPLFHNRLSLTHFDSLSYIHYQKVNELFARRLSPLIESDDLIWVHDYQLIPLGQHLRSAGVSNKKGFFLHIPFPPAETLLALPWHRQLMEDLLAYDLIGFQTERDCEKFRRFVEDEMGGKIERKYIEWRGKKTEFDSFPIGIDATSFAELAASVKTQRAVERMAGQLGQGKFLIGVDRLDYTKGLAEKFYAFEHLIAHYPDYRGMVRLLQIAAPSRDTVPEYRKMRSELEAISGQINGRYGAIDWVPLRYLNKSYSHAQLAAFYRMSRVGMVTPLRDGMNLVAKEYVAAQDPEDPGVLVLSRFAGAAEQLGSGAVVVNPYDIEGTTKAMREALEMPLQERILRWCLLSKNVREQNIYQWAQNFLKRLDRANALNKSEQPPSRGEPVTDLSPFPVQKNELNAVSSLCL